jgi:hypothetical protein
MPIINAEDKAAQPVNLSQEITFTRTCWNSLALREEFRLLFP